MNKRTKILDNYYSSKIKTMEKDLELKKKQKQTPKMIEDIARMEKSYKILKYKSQELKRDLK